MSGAPCLGSAGPCETTCDVCQRAWDTYRANAQTEAVAKAERVLRGRGWLVCPPGHVPMPRSCDEAKHMVSLAERYLKDARE